MYNYKNIYYILLCFLLITILLFLINFVKERNNNINEYKEQEEKNIIEYKADETIRVKMHETNEIVAMDINDYLRGVLPAEMSPTYEIEALKAQAIVARTYTYSKINEGAEGEDADICDYFGHCQAFYSKEKIYQIWEDKGYSKDEILNYWEKINEAVVSTQNMVIVYDNQLIKAFFHASSPVKTENVDQIWNGVSYPYLKSVESIEDESYVNRTSQVCISFNDFCNKINESNDILGFIDESNVENICINEYTSSGRVKNIQVANLIISAEKLRTLIGLKSTNFKITVQDNNIIFDVVGYGHGVGMSQVGANTYAKQGMNYLDIIKHYYTDVEVKKLDEIREQK